MKNENSLRSLIKHEIAKVKKEASKDVNSNEALDDLDTNLPVQVTRFLDKAISAIKGYNLNRRKEALIVAKMIDALQLDKNELMMIINKIKRAGVVQK